MRRSVEFSYEDIVKRNERRGFTTMVKPVGSLCNMRCKYCYYLDKVALYDYRQPQMDDRLLESYIRANIEGNNSPVIAFAWHGGEPLLAGKEFFRKAVALQQRYAEGKTVENSIQTNGLLVDDEWCQIFRDNNFLVGVSIDGPEHIHDAHRVDAGGNPTFARVMKGIERLYRNRVEYNTLTTVNIHSEGRGAEVYKFLRQISVFMQFLPVAELLCDGRVQSPENEGADVAPWSVSAKGFGQFMCDIFDIWVKNDVGRRYVQLFDATLALMVGVQPSVCSLCETCGSGLTVEHNGDVYCCDHFVYPQYKIGNIHTDRLADLAYCDRQFEFGVAKRALLPRECRHCKFYNLCHGECPKHRFIADNTGEYGKNYLCDGYRMFYEYTESAMMRMKQLILDGKPASEIMTESR
ncbi:MAG: anaerobic sulfatase maturase [Alistipes sp.]|nr:anaerobic sulfatase maturase [Alistipes sp.]